MSSGAICKTLKINRLPKSLVVYMFCSPSLNGELRCLPREGGYLDQNNIDMLDFHIIEGRVFDWMRREQEKKVSKIRQKRVGTAGNKQTVTIPFKDL